MLEQMKLALQDSLKRCFGMALASLLVISGYGMEMSFPNGICYFLFKANTLVFVLLCLVPHILLSI
jgi:hypothetical protein